MKRLQVIYYLDALSSWCLIAEPAVDNLLEKLGNEMEFDWRIALLNDGRPTEIPVELHAWQYRRSTAVSDAKLSPGWREGENDSTLWANLAAEAARRLGVADNRVRRALARESMANGKRGARKDVVLTIAAQAGGLEAERLSNEMEDPRTLARVIQTTTEFRKLPVDVLPCFVVTNDIGDKAILSGLYQVSTLEAVTREMLHASQSYESFECEVPAPTPNR